MTMLAVLNYHLVFIRELVLSLTRNSITLIVITFIFMFWVKSLLFHTLETNVVIVMQSDNPRHLHTITIQWKSFVPIPKSFSLKI
jgi:hypothetical protein